MPTQEDTRNHYIRCPQTNTGQGNHPYNASANKGTQIVTPRMAPLRPLTFQPVIPQCKPPKNKNEVHVSTPTTRESTARDRVRASMVVQMEQVAKALGTGAGDDPFYFEGWSLPPTILAKKGRVECIVPGKKGTTVTQRVFVMRTAGPQQMPLTGDKLKPAPIEQGWDEAKGTRTGKGQQGAALL